MSRLTLGIDIDGTLTEFDSFLPYLNRLLNTQVKPEQIIQYDLHEIFGMEYKEFSDLFDQHSKPIYEESIPRLCAKQQLHWIDERFNIVYITARYKEYMDLTERWLIDHGFPVREIVCTGSHDKLAAIEEHQVKIMVEDRLENALQIWDSLQVPVYLLDTPYNQAKLPAGVIRVKDWFQIQHDLKGKGYK